MHLARVLGIFPGVYSLAAYQRLVISNSVGNSAIAAGAPCALTVEKGPPIGPITHLHNRYDEQRQGRR